MHVPHCKVYLLGLELVCPWPIPDGPREYLTVHSRATFQCTELRPLVRLRDATVGLTTYSCNLYARTLGSHVAHVDVGVAFT